MDRRAKPYYYLSSADVSAEDDEFIASFSKDDVAKFLVSILCRTKGREALQKIEARHYQPLVRSGIQSVENLKTFCQAYPQSFLLHQAPSGGDLEVEVTPQIGVCSQHARRAGSCPDDGECGCLHVCKFYILSGKCEFSSKGKCYCHYGHKLASDHNRCVLRSHLMDHLTVAELRTLVKRRCARNQVTRPNICFYYNSKHGCSKGIRCNALHICRNFIFNQCKFGDKCNRNHDLIEPSVIFLLDQYGIDVEDLPEFMLDTQQETKPRPPSTRQPAATSLLGPVPSTLRPLGMG